MNIIKQLDDYLKDNPKRYWFKRKLYGWGWTPALPQGWLVFFLYLAGVIFFATKVKEDSSFVELKQEVIAPIIILTIILIFISYLKGEKPKWQWGQRLED